MKSFLKSLFVVIALGLGSVAAARAQVIPEQDLVDAEQIIAASPDTAEALDLRVELGRIYREQGRFSRSMEHWDQAWAGLKDVPDGPLKQAADSALVNQAHLLASLGRLDDLRVLFKEQVGRTFQNDFLSMM